MSTLPTGTVTFLLTDIEGSTSLWEHYPEAMQASLPCHEEIIALAVRTSDGVLIKRRGEGDSEFAVFAEPANAVAAALDIQLKLRRESWPLPEPLKVRIALHTGEAELRGGDYFGAAVNRCARLRAVAHGGQTILSGATSERVRDRLPAGATLADLGHHRLRDLTEPEHVYELCHPDLPETFPPLRSLDQRLHNLPLQTVPMVGREKELRDVRERLLSADVRLLTLTGPGGIGKTRLALQAAADLADEFEDGVFFVPLASVSDPSLVLPVIAQALGVRESSDRSISDLVNSFLRGKRILLLLDNFEQVLPAAPEVAALLGVSPNLNLLVTSRSVLHVSGEHVYPVPTLALPSEDEGRDPDKLAEYEAIRLFIERARAVRPDFVLTRENADAVRTICRHLDGLPLAIELAAARVRLLSPQAMVRRLSNALPLLTTGARDVPTRQQTLRGAISWSYDLLDPPEKALFRRLSVFIGGCSFDAIEAVIGEPEVNGAGASSRYQGLSMDLLDGISTLMDASLLEQREMDDGEPRFRMLEVIREYGREQLDAEGETETVCSRHADFYLAMAEMAEPHLQGAEQRSWFRRLQIDLDNLRAAIRWYRDEQDAERYLRLVGALFWFWFGQGYRSEALDWYRAALASCPERTRWRAKALYGASVLSRPYGEYDQARQWLEESVGIARELNDQQMVARALHMLGGNESTAGHPAAARPYLEEAMDVARSIDDEWTIAAALRELGTLATQDGDVNSATRFLEESVRIHRRRGERWAQAHSQNGLGDLMRSLALYDQAREAYEESLRIFESLGTKDGRPSVLHNLAYVALNQGDIQHAANLFREALQMFQDMGDQKGIAECLAGFAGVLVAAERPRDAAWTFGAAQAVLDATGTQISASNRTDYGRYLVSTTLALEEQDFSAAFDAGRSTTAEEAIAVVMGYELDALTAPSG